MNEFNSLIARWMFGGYIRGKLLKEIRGGENFAKNKNYILVSNHQSHLDWFIGCYVCTPRKYTYIGQVDKIVGVKGFLRDLMYAWGETIRLDRNDPESKKKVVACSIEVLKKGYTLVMYPEGTRSKDGKLHTFKQGVGMLHIESGVPILPMAMIGTYQMMPPGGKLNANRSVTVVIGKPLDFPELREAAKKLEKDSERYRGICRDIAKKAEDAVRKLIENNNNIQ